MQAKTRFWTGISILIGTCIGAGVLGIPYVASQAGFFVTLGYILGISLIILLVNLYLGEIALRTKGDHQIPGYAKHYLGKTGRRITSFATIFGIFSAIIAYMLGMGESFSFLLFGNSNYATIFGVLIGLGMSGLLWGGINTLKKYEKIGVSVVLLLLLFIVVLFAKNVSLSNLTYFNSASLFLPFGVVLFAMMSFHAIPETRLILHKNEKLLKKIIFSSIFIAVLFYSLFAWVVVGGYGLNTPEIATLALGPIFIFLGIFTMFTSYLAMGNALIEDFMFDDKLSKKKSWFLTSIVPIVVFLLIQFSNYFSFTKILGIGGVISGGITGIMILLMARKAKQKGKRKPEYKIPINWFIIGILILIFVLGILFELGVF
jgi:tyrosine-specific transport protein